MKRLRVRNSRPTPSNIRMTLLGSGVAAVVGELVGELVGEEEDDDDEHPHESVPDPGPIPEPGLAGGGVAIAPWSFDP